MVKKAQTHIVVSGAREHNLKDVSVKIPRDKLVVISGLSGSGKSSLAFDTIYAEGQRRYVESLSAYARQFLGQIDKPDVDHIDGLSPAISIDQKSTSKNPRSTVGTVTEIYDYLRLLFSRVGTPFDPETGEQLSKQTPQQIVDHILNLKTGSRLMILAPVVRGRKGTYEQLFEDFIADGYSRVRIDGVIHELDSLEANLARYEKHDIDVVVDRIVLKKGVSRRLSDSVETALKLAEGMVFVEEVDKDGETLNALVFSEKLSRPSDGKFFSDIEPRNFSFNSPYGACQTCGGLGTQFKVDTRLLIPDKDLSLSGGALAPWANGHSGFHYRNLMAFCDANSIETQVPVSTLPKKSLNRVLQGDSNTKTSVSYKNRYGRSRSYYTRYEGVSSFVLRKWRESEPDSRTRREMEGYMTEGPCPSCKGSRLNSISLAVEISGLTISDVCSMSIFDLYETVSSLEFSDRDLVIAGEIIKEIEARLGFLVDVGLTYLSLNRSSATLSGGEAQRIRLASQIGSGLVGVLYVLDEPSIGLHQRDNKKLIETLVHLRDLGNTVLVVEHDQETMETADYIVDVGPGAGENGGEIVHAGSLAALKKNKKSLTGAFLSGSESIGVPQERRKGNGEKLVVKGATANNLKNVSVEFPLGVMTVVTGVSGSGKSTLVNDVLYNTLRQKFSSARVVPGAHKSIKGLEYVDKVINIDQSPIGRTPRSNPATYTGLFDNIRKLFASTKEAKERGYLPGRFSFNVKGGRCDACRGDGTIKIEMHFLPDVYVPCEVCGGARYNRDTLEIMFKGLSIADVLALPISDALLFFEKQPAITRYLSTLHEVGLGYVRLGQPATTLSGGEAQRVKLATELAKNPRGHTLYLLDEPTTGLHFEDVRKLLLMLSRLVDNGSSVLVIEHNLDVVKSADWVIDLGPQGGDNGGTVVAACTPEDLVEIDGSHTGFYLKELL